jgi:hypothetical protein
MAASVKKNLASIDDRGSKLAAGLPSGLEDATPIPKGNIDPVYEANARGLNHAVSLKTQTHFLTSTH